MKIDIIMKISTVFIPVKKYYISNSDKNLIVKTIRETAASAAKLLKIKEKEITFTLLPLWGDNHGFAQSKEWIRLTIPAKWKSRIYRKNYLEKHLPGLVHHETHHISREYVGFLEKNYKKHTLINSVVSEGLAVSFSEEQVGSLKIESAKYNSKDLKKWFPLIRKEKWSKKYSHDEWFHGRGKPKALGYKIGKYIMDELKKRHPELNSQKLAKADAKKIIKLSGVNL